MHFYLNKKKVKRKKIEAKIKIPKMYFWVLYNIKRSFFVKSFYKLRWECFDTANLAFF